MADPGFHSEISDEEFDKLMKRIEKSGRKEHDEPLEDEWFFQKPEAPKMRTKRAPESFKARKLNFREEIGRKTREEKIEEIEQRAINLVISDLRRKGYSEEFIVKNINLIKEKVLNELYS